MTACCTPRKLGSSATRSRHLWLLLRNRLCSLQPTADGIQCAENVLHISGGLKFDTQDTGIRDFSVRQCVQSLQQIQPRSTVCQILLPQCSVSQVTSHVMTGDMAVSDPLQLSSTQSCLPASFYC